MSRSQMKTARKQKLQVSLAFYLAVLLFTLLSACEAGVTTSPTHVSRQVWVIGYPLEDANWQSHVLTGIGLVHVACWFNIGYSNIDLGSREEVTDKLEIDFGEGAGWQDVTADALAWDLSDHQTTPHVETFTQHTYEEPGEYLIRARVTYWDGEVVESQQPWEEVRVRVLAPEA